NPIFVNVGRLDRVKGQIHLISMMVNIVKQWPEAKLLIVGEGQERAILEEKILHEKLQDHVILTGFRSDIAELISLCDVFLFPSYYEGLPLSLIEAMAVGKPVVASNIPSIAEVIEDGVNGWLVEPANPEALLQRVNQILLSPDRGAIMAHQARASVRK